VREREREGERESGG
jgi:hypothetical protein